MSRRVQRACTFVQESLPRWTGAIRQSPLAIRHAQSLGANCTRPPCVLQHLSPCAYLPHSQSVVGAFCARPPPRLGHFPPLALVPPHPEFVVGASSTRPPHPQGGHLRHSNPGNNVRQIRRPR